MKKIWVGRAGGPLSHACALLRRRHVASYVGVAGPLILASSKTFLTLSSCSAAAATLSITRHVRAGEPSFGSTD